MSNLVDSWLNGIGLGYAVPIFAGQGIDSPDMLSDLDVVDFPELGITDQNDRKKLFYLIQRVKLALDRGRAAETKAAPQADSSVSSGPAEPAPPAVAAAPRATTGRSERERVKAPKAAELGSPRAAHASTRFRRAPEVPAARGPGSPRAGAGFGRLTTPARAQRPPPSHRRPKTPHADGSARGGHHHHQQPQQSSASTRMASPRGSQKRPGDQQEPVDRVAAAGVETGVADLAFEHEAATQALPQEQHRGVSGKRATNTPSARPRRSVLEPVQLDEAGGRASVSSSSSSIAALTTHSAPPPPSAQRCRPPPRENTSQAAGLASRSEATTEEAEEQELRSFDSRPVAVVKTVPAQPPRSARTVDPGSSAAAALARRRSPEGRRRAPSPSDVAPPATAAVPARSLPDPEVARLYPARREAAATTDAAVCAGSRTTEETAAPSSSEVSSWHGNGSVETFPGAPMNERRRRAPPSSSTSLSSSSLPRGDAEAAEGGPDEDGPSRAAGRGRRRSAAELAVHLISAHREDVKSALAAARRDMDLVSMADQDRKPAALMEYAREVESVLGQRLEAGARLRQALDDYVALRQAAARGAVGYEERELRQGRLEGARRAVEA